MGETYGNGMYLHNRAMAAGRRIAQAHGIFGWWSCVKCHCANPEWRHTCNNCYYTWETPNKRLHADDDLFGLQGDPAYWEKLGEKLRESVGVDSNVAGIACGQ